MVVCFVLVCFGYDVEDVCFVFVDGVGFDEFDGVVMVCVGFGGDIGVLWYDGEW